METLSPISDKRIKDSIYELTFGEYVNVVLGDFRCIVLAEDITEEELTNARTVIMADFADLTGDYEHIANMSTEYKRMKLSLKQLSLQLAVKVLTVMYDPETFDFLKTINVIPKDTAYPSTATELNDVINSIQLGIDLINIDLAELNVEKPEQTTQPKKTEPITKKPFIKLLASVSQYVKFSVTFDTNCAIVAEYVNRMRAFQEEMDNKTTKK